MKDQVRARSAFTLIEIIVVVSIIGLLCAILIPNLARSREKAQLTAIQSNLRIIEYAKDQWALENKKGSGEPIPDIATITNYFKRGGIVIIVGEVYTPNAVGLAPTAVAPVNLGAYAKGTPIIAPPY